MTEAESAKDRSLIFVYNADSGAMAALKDYVHKMVKPMTYECNLCAVTYGNLGLKNEWKRFIERIGMPVDFLHMDEYNFDVKRIMKCCVTEILPNGDMIPFCVYNNLRRKDLKSEFGKMC